VTTTQLGTEVTVEELPDLEQAPPCDVLWGPQTCGLPSCVRVRTHCKACGRTRTGFFCRGCWAALKDGQLICRICYVSDPFSAIGNYTYQEI
jgi:hypothetical protein